MYTNSPHYLRSNTLNHLVKSHVGTSHAAINADLIDKIIYDDPAVFRRLRIDQVNRNFIATCTASFNATNAKDISLLMELVEGASKKTPEELEIEKINDMASDLNKEERSGNHGSAEEKKIYDPLGRVFLSNCVFHCSDSFITLKPLKKQGPKPAVMGTIPAIVTQSADYVRLFMSTQPFMLFCVGILIFGTEFCVGIFDRDRITFSPAYDMFQDTDTFIRVVRSLACNLLIKEMGSDPTIRVLTDAETQKLTGSTEGYPHAVVSSGGSDPRQWCTIGPPIWTSLSFLGRGTNVWLVREYVVWLVREYVVGVTQEPLLRGNIMIMKTAWCSSARTPESDIYMSIDQFPEGLAKFECGGDVKHAGYPITMQNLRSHPVDIVLPEEGINPPMPVLHRLILGTVGRPLWEYTSDFDLLAGFHDALQAHKALCDQGILYHDISAGNILLTKNQNAPLQGFITNLEFAHIANSTISKPRVTITSTIGAQNRYDD
ncbi:hypothetical protein PILCRDRAFT_13018 [Piloderma croceum F 1598]|uniref:Fungal-type protein kinase domain-containing protein n=1 Tax=Piloderma croceum (strain F 1598) TaxID=765440 RepID=A0A0C3AQE6_PILCF|nr:hypothetical protein PILCRDRAFT_13018 [Piloderma croceum F 1598]